MQVLWNVMLFVGCVAPDVAKDHSAFIFMDCLTLKKKTLCLFKMLGTVHLTTQYHTPEDLNLQQHCCENLVSPTALFKLMTAT